MTGFWDKTKPLGPSAGLIQQHYLQQRIEELRRRDKGMEKRVQEALATLLPETKSKNWLETYHKIQTRLQGADLTINFKADAWFSTENHFDSYTQTYERNQGAHGRNILLSTAQDPADVRAKVDDTCTIPQAWNTPARPAAVTPGGARTRLGLQPGMQSGQRIAAQMKFGKQIKTTDERLFADTYGNAGLESGNQRFNPKTKQIFAALNYGRRPHGSSTGYGKSHLVINPVFKAKALYYPADTFFTQGENISIQLPYGLLGAVVQTAGLFRVSGVPDVIKSCYNNEILPDTYEPGKLFEAHIFSDLPFTGNIVAIHLDAPHGSIQHKNAKKFAEKHGARLTLM